MISHLLKKEMQRWPTHKAIPNIFLYFHTYNLHKYYCTMYNAILSIILCSHIGISPLFFDNSMPQERMLAIYIC